MLWAGYWDRSTLSDIPSCLRWLQMSELELGVCMCKIMAVSLLVLASVGDDGSRQQTLWQKRRNGDDLTVAPELQLLNESIKKTFTHRDDSDSTKSVGRVFKEDQSGPADGEQLLPEKIRKERTCRLGSASLGAVISGEPCSAPQRTDFLQSAKAREFIKHKRSGCLTDWREGSFHTPTNTSYSTKSFSSRIEKIPSGLWRRIWGLSPRERASVSQMADLMGAMDFPHSSL